MIRITAKLDGFRRAGMAHSRTPVEHPDGTFAPEQLAALQGESMLVVEIIGEEPKPNGKGPTAAEQIEKLKAAATVEEITIILGDDKRATVLAAAEARNAELATPPAE